MKIKVKSIQIKIMLWGGLCLVLLAAALIIYSANNLFNNAVKNSEQNVTNVAISTGAQAKAEIEVALDTSRTMAEMLKSMKTGNAQLSRSQVNAMLRQVLEDSPKFLGTYTLWEPNAFDGQDEMFAGKVGNDASGRLIPYWSRDDKNNITVSPLVDYEKPGAGDWYLVPKDTKTEAVVGPLIYPVGGVDILMTSQVAPIVVNGQFLGIAGVDLRLDALQKFADGIDLYNKSGVAALVSYDGVLGGVTGKPQMGGKELKDFSATWQEDLAIIQKGETRLVTRNGVVSVFTPIQLGGTTKPWAVMINVSLNAITADAQKQMLTMILIGLVMTLAALWLLWFAGGLLARPVRKITAAAQEIARGDLGYQVETRQDDEIGQLADAFRGMSASLLAKARVMG